MQFSYIKNFQISGVPATDECSEARDTVENPKSPSSEDSKQQIRGGRNDRSADARRYHTAGAIEDIKVNISYR